MIDTSLTLAPQLFDAAEGGDDAQLRAALSEASLDPAVVDAIVGAVTGPEFRFTVVSADDRGAAVRRAHLSPVVSLLHADGDDRETPGTVLVTRSAAELLHVVLGGFAFGPRPDHPSTEPVTLEDPEDAVRIPIGERELPSGIVPPTDRPVRWWSFGFELEGQPPLTVLDAASLWRQTGAELVPTDALTVWQELAAVLRRLNAFERPDGPDDVEDDVDGADELDGAAEGPATSADRAQPDR